MRLWSDSWVDGDPIPPRCAAARPDATRRAVPGGNRNPHLAWDGVPAGTRGFALIAHDFDLPVATPQTDRADRELDEDTPRTDFFHWVLADLPGTLREIAEGAFSDGFTPRGKAGPEAPLGSRQGRNDFTRRLADDPVLAGVYHGYDGPWPPHNDPLVHHVVFTLYALDVARAPVEAPFDGDRLRRAIVPHVLAEATLSGTYTLNPRLLA